MHTISIALYRFLLFFRNINADHYVFNSNKITVTIVCDNQEVVKCIRNKCCDQQPLQKPYGSDDRWILQRILTTCEEIKIWCQENRQKEISLDFVCMDTCSHRWTCSIPWMHWKPNCRQTCRISSTTIHP